MNQVPTMNSEAPTTDKGSPSAEILVIGLGNPILGDDGVGWKVVQEVGTRLDPRSHVEVDCLAVGGLSLMERMLGYSHVILVDSMQTGNDPEGTVRLLALNQLENPALGHSGSAHDASLMTALQTAAIMGAAIPKRVDIVAIEANRCYDFADALSPQIAAAVPVAARKVLDLLCT